jgi:hypothetical protein
MMSHQRRINTMDDSRLCKLRRPRTDCHLLVGAKLWKSFVVVIV